MGQDQVIRFEDISHLESLSPDDYLTIRLYANNDMGNTLWEYAFQKNGLHTSYRIPATEVEFNPEPLGNGAVRVRTLGGLRLEYKYILPAGSYFDSGAGDSITWSMGVPGRYCTDYGVGANNCTTDHDGTLQYTTCHPDSDPSQRQTVSGNPGSCAVYWEPVDPAVGNNDTYWSTTLAAMNAEVQVDYTDASGADVLESREFQIETRELRPQNPDPMQGSDVEMLETMLWQLGLSPQYHFPGKDGTRLGEVSGTLGGSVGGANGSIARKTYSTGVNGARGAGSLERMVKRFQGRNISAADIGKVARYRGDSSNGIVDGTTLSDLSRIWADYFSAYQGNVSTGQISKNDSRMAVWLTGAIGIWDSVVAH